MNQAEKIYETEKLIKTISSITKDEWNFIRYMNGVYTKVMRDKQGQNMGGCEDLQVKLEKIWKVLIKTK